MLNKLLTTDEYISHLERAVQWPYGIVMNDEWTKSILAQLKAARELAKALNNFNLGEESPFSENMKYEFADNALQDWKSAGGTR